ncbi:hypothetical protein GCM10025859_23690 [Alicyclobacillus fastidiosus]|nr:beta-L-arabinofuranosidase domain-containing protein [Alicyclobacillus fastidiosus]GMA61929.1 hypothetical protein GCM10025859_23690 [Alicyclobacillus fastidiosus]
MSEETFRIVEIVKFQELQAVPLKNVRLEDTFWSWRLQVHKDVTLEACLHHCEEKGRIRNFAKAAGQSDGEFEGIYTFNDTDVYKTLEGVAYSLMLYPNEQLEQKCDEIIDLIAAAQQTDGYLCTFFTLKEPDKKWTDMNSHEMYCGGHLMEAAVAYRQATGKNKLLDVARKLADHYDDTFGPGKRHWVEGHEEIGIGLVSLYRETGEERYWKLAQWLLEERGKGHGVGRVWKMEGLGPEYSQDHVPVRETVDVRGHAVRAMYLYSAVADIAAITRDREYLAALHRAWDSVVFRNMYITGGIGSSGHNEGFKEDYDLPNETAYCETCASIGMVYWNHRLNLLHADAKYADILERSLYNGVLAGVSLSGKEFFYDNPLASDGSHHRLGWFECSCCPTQVSRFIPTLGKYIYAFGERGIWVNLYVASTSVLMVGGYEVGIVQKENYPWEGTVALSIETSAPRQFEFNLRLPGWCKQATVSVMAIGSKR